MQCFSRRASGGFFYDANIFVRLIVFFRNTSIDGFSHTRSMKRASRGSRSCLFRGCRSIFGSRNYLARANVLYKRADVCRACTKKKILVDENNDRSKSSRWPITNRYEQNFATIYFGEKIKYTEVHERYFKKIIRIKYCFYKIVNNRNSYYIIHQWLFTSNPLPPGHVE